ncbi:hypothetical protein TRAPUB_1508 [Trametes pubescens]|uniref:Uncharacterized protein n=1 Tax=Trametes pubescens TaxID=154538 RepID=A0A1M2W7Q3_TRAPU|nr:hypothetical protein TRAPUB_1508 [Trametes pubescens]
MDESTAFTSTEPMTRKQRGKLYYLWKSTGICVPFADDRKLHTNTQAVTKAEAWVLIRMLLDGVRPTSAYIDSLGRSLVPLAWLTRLISVMGVPRTVMHRTLDSLTLGQASVLIGRLREDQEQLFKSRGAMVMLENAVKYVQAELPTQKGRTTWRPQ